MILDAVCRSCSPWCPTTNSKQSGTTMDNTMDSSKTAASSSAMHIVRIATISSVQILVLVIGECTLGVVVARLPLEADYQKNVTFNSWNDRLHNIDTRTYNP
jgi:hypothetical protein